MVGYVLCWATLVGGAGWAYVHLAILLLSGSAFFIHSVLACHRGAADEVLACLGKFTWGLLGLAALESLTGVRLPVSRYSPLAPSLGFVYEGHEGFSPLVDGLWIPTGLFGNQNNLAFAVLCLLPFALAAQRGVLSRCALVVLAGAVIIVSESRTALVVGACWLIVALGSRLLKRAAPIALLVFAMVVGAAWASGLSVVDALCAESSQKLCFAIGLVENLSLSDLELGHDSISVRFQLARQALAAWGESPIVGVGPGHLGSLISALHSEGVVITDAHNAPLQILAEYGLLGAAIWAVCVFIVGVAVVRMPEREPSVRSFKSAAKTFLVLLPFASVTVSTMYYFVPVWVLAGAMLGVALGERDNGACVRADACTANVSRNR